jgi:hypothetical protein
VPIVRHIDAADAQRAARRSAMRIFAQSNPQVLARGVFSSLAKKGSTRKSFALRAELYRSTKTATTRAASQPLAR